MTAQTQADVTIVGAGIVGICCALSLQEKGKRVRLIDKDAPGQGASHGNAGVISPWSCVPQSMPGLWKKIPGMLLDPEGPVAVRPAYLPKFLPWAVRFLRAGRADRVAEISAAMAALVRPNVDIYRRHLAGTGHEHLVQASWYVHLYRNAAAADLNGLGWRLRAAEGAPIEVVSGDELREIEPCVSPDYQAAILVKDQARALSPGRIGAVLADKVRALGGEVLRTRVHRLQRDGDGWSLATDEGELRSAQVVTAAGAWSLGLLEPFGVRLPLVSERGYHLLFRSPGVTLANSVVDVEAKFVTSSMEMGLRSAGTAEFARADAKPNDARARMLAKQTKRILPDLDTADTEEWMGVRPSLPDSLPCIGEVPGQPGLFTAFGHSHYGLGMAPMTGRIVADLATGTPPNLDLSPYSLTRFGRFH
ncbi:MAG: FAD-binding oxidoreductase [Hyphomicrobiales bacterium]|nr:FAD-binding oxidoreductase [Hyphomicrobiales bacterium]